jgi:hypothetical protein
MPNEIPATSPFLAVSRRKSGNHNRKHPTAGIRRKGRKKRESTTLRWGACRYRYRSSGSKHAHVAHAPKLFRKFTPLSIAENPPASD